MTKRFEIVHLRNWNVCDILDNAQEMPTFYNDLGRIESVQPVCDLLNELSEEKEIYKMLWEQMSYYFRDGVELRDLDDKDFRALQRLSKGLVD